MLHQLSVTVFVHVSSTRGCHQVEFTGSFNRKPIPGPSVNLTIIPDPTKPVMLLVKYNTDVRFPAGGTFPGLHLYLLTIFNEFCFVLNPANWGQLCLCSVFAVTVVSDEGGPITTCNPAHLSMLLWGGESSTPPPRVSYWLKRQRLS